MRERRPHVILKAGMTLDGKIADLHSASRWITGAPARARSPGRGGSAASSWDQDRAARRSELTVRLGRPWPREPFRVAHTTRTPRTARAIGQDHRTER
jgi:riboflavin biosynthesis pyrimidine reductase